MKPSIACAARSGTARVVVARFRAATMPVFGSVRHRGDEGDRALAVAAPPGAPLPPDALRTLSDASRIEND